MNPYLIRLALHIGPSTLHLHSCIQKCPPSGTMYLQCRLRRQVISSPSTEPLFARDHVMMSLKRMDCQFPKHICKYRGHGGAHMWVGRPSDRAHM